MLPLTPLRPRLPPPLDATTCTTSVCARRRPPQRPLAAPPAPAVARRVAAAAALRRGLGDDDDDDDLDPITGAPPRGRRGRAGRPTASQLDDDDEDEDDEDDEEDEDEDDDDAFEDGFGLDDDDDAVSDPDADALDDPADLAAALPGDDDDDDDDPAFLMDDLPAVDDDDDAALGVDALAGLLDSAAAGTSAPGSGRRRGKGAAAAAAAAEDDPLLPFVGLPDEDDDVGGAAAAAPAVDDTPAVEYPDPPTRAEQVGALFARAGVDADAGAAAGVTVTGVDDDPAVVLPGDLFVTSLPAGPARDAALAAAAAAGAVAALVPDDGSDVGGPLPCARAADPARAGAAAARAFYDDPTSVMSVVLFVGGPGKTTASWLTRGVLEESGALVGMVGSLEYALHADRLAPTGALWSPSEPDPTLERDCSTAFHASPYKGKYPLPPPITSGVRLQRVAAGAADRGATAAVVELSAAALAAGAAEGVAIDVAVYTGPPVREDGAPDEAGLEAVTALFASLRDADTQRAIVYADDDYKHTKHADILEAASRVPAITYAMYNKHADVFAQKAAFSLWETELLARTPVGALSIATPLVGKHNVAHVLAAVAAGLAVAPGGAALDLKTIVRGVEATEVVPGRCEPVDEGQPFAVLVDAARTPKALTMLLDSVHDAGAKRIILVFGCKGNKLRALRPFLGEVAHYKADIVIITNDSPAGENPADIVADIVTGFPDALLEENAKKPYPPGFLQDPGRVDAATAEFLWDAAREYGRHVCEDRWMAIRWAIGTAGPDDAVIIAGKGADDFQLYAHGDTGALFKAWFDDRVEARNALARAVDLWGVTGLDRSELPWQEWEEREPKLAGD